jgi:hypothetical protein
LTISALANRSVLQRILLGLGIGALLGFMQVQFGLGILFLIGLCGAAAILTVGLGLARFPIALAIWAGQYAVIWLRVVAPSRRFDQMGAMPSIINDIVIFMPTLATLAGTYLGLALERSRKPAP